MTISSTFQDLEEHRAALINILTGQGLFPVAMENDSARPGADVIASSLEKVQEGAAYIGIISRRYGQVPECRDRNPDNLSITELEFDEAVRLGRPILLFLMGETHPVREADVELDPERRQKLQAFRERAKRTGPESKVSRVYDTFNSLQEFKDKAARAVAELDRYLQVQAPAAAPQPAPDRGTASAPAPIPTPPAFYAEPPYIGSHTFVGRRAELEQLSDWAAPADPHPVLLFEAIGGSGKSMLTWEWTTNHATAMRGDWAGRFWYSFYEKGAVMADFCRRALAYITGQPLKEFQKKKTPELSDLLLLHLQARPWLLVLDGLERVLVAYHRYDAAQLADEEAGTSDQIARRDPLDAIRPEDDELLRLLASATPSKLLLTSRLMPRVLLNRSNQPIPGVLRLPLPGLRPPDAEALLRSAGVTGTSQGIQDYLKIHCDCHPLVTGVLAGLINDYLPNRGNFDAWAADPAAGGQLNLADLDLVQKRNHILNAAIAALPEKSRELLSTLALLSQAVDYEVLSALNPHLPPEPEEVPEPLSPESWVYWTSFSKKVKHGLQEEYKRQAQRWREYTHAMTVRSRSTEFRDAPRKLADTVRDLERRGLLQYDRQAKRHDLHPVVRGIASGGLGQDEKNRYGQRVVDYFSQQTHGSYTDAESLDDLRHGIQVVRTLLQMGRQQQAYEAFTRDHLVSALQFTLEAHAEALSLIHAFSSQGWESLADTLPAHMASSLATEAGVALESLGKADEALAVYAIAVVMDVRAGAWANLASTLGNAAYSLDSQRRFAKKEFCIMLALEFAKISEDDAQIFVTRLHHLRQLAKIGKWDSADTVWRLLDPMGRDWPQRSYRPGNAEFRYAQFRFWRGDLSEDHLSVAEDKANLGKNRFGIRMLHWLRGSWHLERGEWASAAESLHDAVRMAREVGQIDSLSEGRLAVAKLHLGQLPDPRHEAERLAAARDVHHRSVAELWLAIGELEEAKKHALAAYKEAWADGEPYVFRYELNRARELLERLGVEVPDLPPYDPARDEKLPWEDEVVAAIEELRREKQAAAERSRERH